MVVPSVEVGLVGPQEGWKGLRNRAVGALRHDLAGVALNASLARRFQLTTGAQLQQAHNPSTGERTS